MLTTLLILVCRNMLVSVLEHNAINAADVLVHAVSSTMNILHVMMQRCIVDAVYSIMLRSIITHAAPRQG